MRIIGNFGDNKAKKWEKEKKLGKKSRKMGKMGERAKGD